MKKTYITPALSIEDVKLESLMNAVSIYNNGAGDPSEKQTPVGKNNNSNIGVDAKKHRYSPWEVWD